jgi:tRNA uracil 4-sulfurtransferase
VNDRIVIHYSEIALKGKNREYFEIALTRHIKSALGSLAQSVQRRFGRIICTPTEGADQKEMKKRLARIPGIVHFSIGTAAPPELEAIKARALEMTATEDFTTFGVRTKRSDKSFPMTSAEISAKVGSHVLGSLNDPRKKVDLDNPDFRLTIELTHGEAFLYGNKFKGPGGLPVGTSGRVLASLSGGLDSPVAAYMMMKRGCEVVFVHIRNETQFAHGAVSKIEDLVRQLTGFQLRSKLYIVPFGDLQRQIIAFVPAKYRMIVYRRFMMRILNRIAGREKAKGIVTGDSVGQVASQTMHNLHCIHAAAALPVLSPLIGMNKEETVDLARQIGTYEFSTIPYPDCCSFMIAPHPETRGDLEKIQKYEAALEDVDTLVMECVKNAEIRRFRQEIPSLPSPSACQEQSPL